MPEEVQKRVQSSRTPTEKSAGHHCGAKDTTAKRRGFTQKATPTARPLSCVPANMPMERLAEIFYRHMERGATMRSMLNCFATVHFHRAPVWGTTRRVRREICLHAIRAVGSGRPDHLNIKSATSIVDFIFRALAYEYLRTDGPGACSGSSLRGQYGLDSWDPEDSSDTAARSPELSDVRIVAKSAGKPNPSGGTPPTIGQPDGCGQCQACSMQKRCSCL